MADLYDYREAVKDSVIDWLKDHKKEVEAHHSQMDEDEFAEWVIDECIISDSVTGNASGSYTFSIHHTSYYRRRMVRISCFLFISGSRAYA